jgi:hypothetical protein
MRFNAWQGNFNSISGPDEFVARCIFAKLPSSWRSFVQLSNTRDIKYQLKTWYNILMLRINLGLRTLLRRRTRAILASTCCSITHIKRTKEIISVSMSNQQLPSRKRRRIK